MALNAAQAPRVLAIAGTDPTGGAGIQADLKSIAALRGYGMAVVTALVAQNTTGVRAVHTPPVSFLGQQLDAVSDDVVIDAVKIGMLGNAEIVETVHGWIERTDHGVVVLDPVMVATSGDRLLDGAAEGAVKRLLPRVDLVTPNLPELAVLADADPAESWDALLDQGRGVAETFGVTVLVKGGHLVGDRVCDAIVEPGAAPAVVESPRVDTRNTHGTGCSLSAAMATLRPRHDDWHDALVVAKEWLTDSIRAGHTLEVGRGHGPVSHFARIWAGE